MSVVDDHVRRLDARVDRIHASLTEESFVAAAAPDEDAGTIPSLSRSTVSALGGIARSLSAHSSSGPQLKHARLLSILHAYEAIRDDLSHAHEATGDSYVPSLAWVVAAKASVQAFALVTNTLLEQTIPLSDEIYYWNEVLGSHFYTGLYTVQTSPLRIARYLEGVYHHVHDGFRSPGQFATNMGLNSQSTLTERWNAFYGLVRESVRRESFARAKMTVLSPFGLSRSEARRRRMRLKQLREKNACAVGLLMEESLLVEVDEDDVNKPNVNLEDWQDIILRSTLLIQTVLQTVNDVDADLPEFEEAVFAHVSRSAEEVGRSFIGEQRPEDPTEHPTWVIRNLIQTLEQHLPSQRTLFKASSHQYGRPSRLVRYWLPATLLLFSSSTILNILTSRRAELITWVRELGVTVRDFWRNWVIDPLARLIGTIRHDERSEVALMTKQTLQEDRDSLERMVVDFAIDRPIDGRQYSPSEIEMIRSRVKEGDVTPVLRAYERDLRRPFVGTVRGDLVRALLIQVQKTKVDVEVSIAGIDSMLKSQQLVFGVVALTPGILVSYATLRWIAGFFGSRRGIRMGRRRGEMLRALRAVDRVLTASTPTARGTLSYKDHGLLVCEVEVFRQRAEQVLPGVLYHELLEDLGDLLNVRTGVAAQSKVLERIRWAYARWIQ